MDITGIVALAFCILGIPVGVGFWIGWVARGRNRPGPSPGATSPAAAPEADHVAWLLDELDKPPFDTILDDADRQTIAAFHGRTPAAPSVGPERPIPTPVAANASATEPGPDIETPVFVGEPAPVTGYTRSPLAAGAAPQRSRAEWDPAVLMLYLGAFLVVAAGLVYASYNWGELGAWQKLGFLAAATIAFAGTGVALLSNQRVRPAAETFVVIGALLVPANAVAAYAVFEQTEARTALIVLLGSLVTALVYGAFSLRPGGVIYSYGTVIAGALAIGALLPAFGSNVGWGAVLLILAIAAVPDASGRLRLRWLHVRNPLRRVGIVALPIATLVGLGSSFETNDWVVPATTAAATIALARFAAASGHRMLAALCTLPGIGTVAGLLIALDVEMASAWAIAAILTSGVVIGLGERGPTWIREGWLRTLLHIEAVLGFIAAAVYAGDGSPWHVTAALAIGTMGTAVITLLRNARWWLLIPGFFATATWLSIADFFDPDDWERQSGLLFGIPLPLLLGAVAFGLDRWSRREVGRTGAWGEPVWLVAGIDATFLTALPLGWWAEGEARLLVTLAWSSALFGIVSLVSARSIGRPLVRAAFGVWAAIAIGAVAWELPLIVEDRLPVVVVLAAIVAAISPRFFRLPNDRSTPAEIVVLGALLFGTLIAMLLVSASFVLDPSHAGEPGVRWTWAVYLAVFAAISGGAAWLGFRLGRRGETAPGPLEISAAALPGISLLFGVAAIGLLVRLVTTDPLAWTWAGLLVAAVLLTISQLVANRLDPANAFVQQSRILCGYAGAGLGVVAVLANLAIAFDAGRGPRDWAQLAIYGAIGIVAMGLALTRGQATLTYVSFGALTLAVIFGVRAMDGDSLATVTTLIVFAWVVAGSSLALPRSGPWTAQRPAWITSALGIGGLAVILAVDENDAGGLDSRAWQLLVVSFVSLAGLLTVDAVVRRERSRGVAASGIAMLALLLQIAVDDPANIQAYTIPLGLYLLALGFVQRRHPASRDILLGMGSAALLVPALLDAVVDEQFSSLLLAGGEALALFLGGLALRLRVPIAAGMAAITLIALRMMVDAVVALPSWITLLAVGLVLLGGGTVLLIWKEAFRSRLERMQRNWHEMG